MPTSQSKEILQRALLWIFCIYTDLIGALFVNLLPEGIETYYLYLAWALVVLAGSFQFEASPLLRDMREVFIYDALIHVLAICLYKLGSQQTGFIHIWLAGTIMVGKYVRLLWPCKTGADFAAWPRFGMLALLERRTRAQECNAEQARLAYLTMLLLLASGLNMAWHQLLLTDDMLSVSFLLCFPWITKYIRNYITQKETETAQAEQARLAAERKVLEAERQERLRLRQYNITLRNAAHDLRTPLEAIDLCAENLINAAPEDVARRQQTLRKSLSHMRGKLDRIIFEAMLSTGFLEARRHIMNVPQFVDEITVEHADLIIRAGLRPLRCHVSPGLYFSCDAFILRRIIGNLLGNVIKHAPKGSAVSFSLRRHGEQVVLRVWDSGGQLACPQGTDRAANFATLLQRLPGNGKTGIHGLGLHSLHQLCQALGTQMRFYASPRRGTLFSCRLPI